MPPTPWLLFAAIAVLTLAAGGILLVSEDRRPTAATSSLVAAHSYAQAVRAMDDAIEEESARADQDPRAWLVRGTLSQSYRSRAQLTGDYADFARAQEALESAFAIAPAGAGPVLARAQLHASMHRWELMEPDLRVLEHALPKSWERAVAASLRGEYAFQSGRYDEALAEEQQAMALDPNPVRLFALADLRNATGDPLGADRLLDQAEKLVTVHDYPTSAWVQMQRGVILEDRGDLAGARAWFQRADATMPGWWRVQGRLAEIAALRGDQAGAAESYRDLVKSTGHAEFMDALGRLALQRGDVQDARHWTVMGWTVYEQELASFPEAACGHALDHALDLSGDPVLALRLARENHRLRPGGEASLKLARALLMAGETAQARTCIETLLAGPWDVMALHRAAAQIFRACGDVQAAQREERKVVAR